MIAVKQTRNNGMFHDFGTQEMSAREAAGILMLAEIAFGGRVKEISPERIFVETNVMGCIDQTAFTGPSDEMAMLHNCLDTYFAARENKIVHGQGIARAVRISGGNPGVLSLCPELLAFGRLARVSFLVGIGLTDPEEIKIAMSVPDEDLDAALALRLEEGVSIAEIVS